MEGKIINGKLCHAFPHGSEASTPPQQLWNSTNSQVRVQTLPLVEELIYSLQECRRRRGHGGFAKFLHHEICYHGLDSHPVVGNHLIPMLSECGDLHDSRRVLFQRLFICNEFSWASVVKSHISCGEHDLAVSMFESMGEMNIQPSSHLMQDLIKSCILMRCLKQGRKMHGVIAIEGFESNMFVGSSLVEMYGLCNSLEEARCVFDDIPIRDVALWNTLIRMYTNHGFVEEAIVCFEEMQHDGKMSPSPITYVTILKAVNDIEKARELHIHIVKEEYEGNPFLATTLVGLYLKCGFLLEAQEVFDGMITQDVVSWTALITGYIENGFSEKAWDCLKNMPVDLDETIIICCLQAFGSVGDLNHGLQLHLEIVKEGFEGHSHIGNTLVDMYGKCGVFTDARSIFDELEMKDIVSWNALIGNYANYGSYEEALSCLEQMQVQCIPFNAITFVSIFKVLGIITAVEKIHEMHGMAIMQGFERESFVGSALVDAYANCGSLTEAHQVFDNIRVRDLVSWTALISGYAYHGESEAVFEVLDRMKDENINPDQITFQSIFTACSHSGLLDSAQKYFEVMVREYGIVADIEHKNCMLDLVARAGRLDEAFAMLERDLFVKPNSVTFNAMLGACNKWGNVELGWKAFNSMLRISDDDHCRIAAYQLMAIICGNSCE